MNQPILKLLNTYLSFDKTGQVALKKKIFLTPYPVFTISPTIFILVKEYWFSYKETCKFLPKDALCPVGLKLA